MMKRSPFRRLHRTRQAGLTLVELMIAMLLGLLIVGGAISLLFSNKQAYNANAALGQLQDSTRVAFEMMARDIRQTGLTGCGNFGRVANVLKNGPNGGGTVKWYADIANAIVGYDGTQNDPAVTTGTAAAQRVSGTSSMQMVGSDGVGFTVNVDSPGATTPNFTLNETSTTLQQGDIVVLCDPDHAAITQITKLTAGASITLEHAASGTPGNCSSGLGFPTTTPCTGTGNVYTYATNSQVSKWYAADWYVGYNKVGGKSLYRMALSNSGGVPAPAAQEMVRGVTDMQIVYNRPNTANANVFESATSVGTDWAKVAAVRITLSLESSNAHASATGSNIDRTVTTTIALRNRL